MLKFYLQNFAKKNFLGQLDQVQINLILESEYTLGKQAICFVQGCLKNEQHVISSLEVNDLIDSISQTFLPLKIVHGPPKEVLFLDQFFYKASQQGCDLCILNLAIK